MSRFARRLQQVSETIQTAPSSSDPTVDAGSVPVGSANYAIPAGAIFVDPNSGNDTTGNGTQGTPYRTAGKAFAVLAAGGTVVLRGGVYHEGGAGQAGLSGIQIFDNNATVQNYPGEAVWFDGSSQVTNWTQEGSNWSTPFTVTMDHSPTWTRGADDSTVAYYGFINPSFPCAAWPEMVFVDGVQLTQVNSLAAVTSTTFYVAGSSTGGTGSNKYDFNPTKIYIGINPAGHEVRVSDLQACITAWSGTSGVTIRGIGIRRYATSMPMAACLKISGSNATVENVWIEDIATVGMKANNANITFRHITATRCGNQCIAGYQSDNLVLDSVKVTYGNYEHFNYAPDCGGSKFGACRKITIFNSLYANNYAKGVWFDVSVDQPIVYNCNFIDNEHYGIFYEISANGVCANNLIKGSPNKGLMINNTDNMRIWNNTVVDSGGNSQEGGVRPFAVYQDDRSPFPAGAVFGRDNRQGDSYYTSTMTWTITHIEIMNNVVAQPRSGTQGIFAIDDVTGNARTLPSYGVTMNGNVFHWVTKPTYPYILPPATAGGSTPVTYQSHTAFVSGTGLDTNGSEIVPTSPVDGTYNVTSSTLHNNATGLPSDIATLIGQPAGTKHAGVWR